MAESNNLLVNIQPVRALWSRLGCAAFFLMVTCSMTCLAQSGGGRRGDDEDDLSSQTSYACQNDDLFLQCYPGEVIRIVRANYGRFSLRVCNDKGLTGLNIACKAVSSFRTIATECDGHTSCSINVSNYRFGDPCPGTLKYVEVKHYCETGPRVLVPQNIIICLQAMATGTVYDIYWEIPQSLRQTILHFILEYSVDGEIYEQKMSYSSKVNETHYAYTFHPQTSHLSSPYQFAIKAYSPDYEWGEYSDFHSAQQCHGGQFSLTFSDLSSMSTTTTSTKVSHHFDAYPFWRMCPAVRKMDFDWPSSLPDTVHTAPCPHIGYGTMWYKCLASGVWQPNGPVIETCYYTPPKKSTMTSSSTTYPTYPPFNVSSPPPPPITVNISHLMGGSDFSAMVNMTSTFPVLLRNMSLVINSMSNVKERQSLAHRYMDDMLHLGDEMLESGNSWRNMTVTQQQTTASSLLTSIESTGLMLASTMEPGSINMSHSSNFAMKVMNIDLFNGRPAVLLSEMVPLSSKISKDSHFTIPNTVLHQISHQGAISVVFVVTSNMSDLFAPKPVFTTSSNGRGGAGGGSHSNDSVIRTVNSDIVSVSVSSARVRHLVEPVSFLLEHRQRESVANPQCVYWNTVDLEWSTGGCWLHHTNKSHTACQCDHLTSFAILMDITGSVLLISPDARFSLQLITYIGCIISILCLFLSWITFAMFKSLDCDRNTVHKHLVFCLMVAQTVLVVGIERTSPKLLCSVIAGLMHFFFLAAFAWMCLEGVQLYVLLIQVFSSDYSQAVYFYLFGYGFPSIIVAVSAIVFPSGYGTEHYCWLTTDKGFIWSFVGPTLAVITVNVIMLTTAIYVMVRHSGVSHSIQQKSTARKIRTWLKGSVVLVAVLGLTWVFGALLFGNTQHTVLSSHIFTLLNSLQGLFIFVFHCLMNEKVQKEYRRYMRYVICLPDCILVRYGTTASFSKDSSSSGNLMARFFKRKRLSYSTGISAKPFFENDHQHNSGPSSSSDGPSSSRLSTGISCKNNNNLRKPSRITTEHPIGMDVQFLNYHGSCGIPDELSEAVAFSVVEDEFLSEYCQHNLEVRAERESCCASSGESVNNCVLGGYTLDYADHHDPYHLAVLSEESLHQHLPQDLSDGWADSDNVDGEEEESDKCRSHDFFCKCDENIAGDCVIATPVSEPYSTRHVNGTGRTSGFQ